MRPIVKAAILDAAIKEKAALDAAVLAAIAIYDSEVIAARSIFAASDAMYYLWYETRIKGRPKRLTDAAYRYYIKIRDIMQPKAFGRIYAAQSDVYDARRRVSDFCFRLVDMGLLTRAQAFDWIDETPDTDLRLPY